MQTHFSPSLLTETRCKWAGGQSGEWEEHVERLLGRSVQLRRRRTHLRRLWTALPRWVRACLQRTHPFFVFHLVVYQQLECQGQLPGWFPLQTLHWPSYHGDGREERVAYNPHWTRMHTHTTLTVVKHQQSEWGCAVSEVKSHYCHMATKPAAVSAYSDTNLHTTFE